MSYLIHPYIENPKLSNRSIGLHPDVTIKWVSLAIHTHRQHTHVRTHTPYPLARCSPSQNSQQIANSRSR